MNWCVVIPTFNNGKTLEKVVNDVLKVTTDVIVVNDGSTDHTAEILKKFPQINTITYARNRGKGYALKQGFIHGFSRGFSYAITLDADAQHKATDIQAFVEGITEYPGALIVGSRTLPQEKLRKGSGFANKFSNFWFRFIAGNNLPDTQSGFRLYPLLPLNPVRFYSNKYEFELEVLIRASWRGVPVTSIPIDVYYPDKSERVSHFRPLRDFIRISILYTICFFIALFYIKPFAFLRYLKKENIKGFLNKHVFQTGDSFAKITFSVMLGIFMGIVPIWGYQLITAIALAYILRLNKVIVIVTANISIPPMIPLILYLSYLTGGWVLSMDNNLAFSHDISFTWVRDNLFQYIVGSVVFATIASLIMGIVTFVLLRIFRTKPATIS